MPAHFFQREGNFPISPAAGRQAAAPGRSSRQVGTAAWRWLPPLRCRASRWVPGEVGPGSLACCLSSSPGPGQPGSGAHPGLEEAPCPQRKPQQPGPLRSPWSQWSQARAATAKIPQDSRSVRGVAGREAFGWLCWFCSPVCCTSFFRHRPAGLSPASRGGRKTIQPHPPALLCIIGTRGVTSWRPAERGSPV